MRTIIKPELNACDNIVEAASWILLIALWAYVIQNFFELSDIIAVHFSFEEKANRYGSKAVIFIIPIVATFATFLLSLINRWPHIFNYPIKITVSNVARQYTLATRLLRMLKIFILVVSGMITFQFVRIVNDNSSLHGVTMLSIILFPIFLPLIIYLRASLRSR